MFVVIALKQCQCVIIQGAGQATVHKPHLALRSFHIFALGVWNELRISVVISDDLLKGPTDGLTD